MFGKSIKDSVQDVVRVVAVSLNYVDFFADSYKMDFFENSLIFLSNFIATLV